MSVISDTYLKLHAKWSLQRTVAELLSKRWMEPAVPFIMMLGVIVFCAVAIPNYLTLDNLTDTSSQFAEFGFVVLAMTVVLVVGGIDLSVGAIFAMADFIALVLFNVYELPIGLVVILVLLSGGLLGAINGFLIGYLKLGAFLTTLVTLIIIRATFDLTAPTFAIDIATSYNESAAWEFLG
ncbi:MAG: ABC transporter permease, partial [Rhodospirillaceae bacterium]|nr:ABC transporter permease [Rhodospirillaceae bacterium]